MAVKVFVMCRSSGWRCWPASQFTPVRRSTAASSRMPGEDEHRAAGRRPTGWRRLLNPWIKKNECQVA